MLTCSKRGTTAISGYNMGCRCDRCASGKAGYDVRRKEKSRKFRAAHKAVPCADCGIEYPSYVMDFDHRDPTEKLFNIATAWNRSREVTLTEMDKCDVVCANCHRERTHGAKG